MFIVKTAAIIILIIIVILYLLGKFIRFRDSKRTKTDVLKYIIKNREHCSFTVIKDGEKLIDFNSSKITSLASTMKIILAIAFVRGVANGILNPDECIDMEDIDCFHLPGTDGNAHSTWIEQENIGPKTTLLECVKGMAKYSSNACTDCLYMRLGEGEINKVIEDFQLTHHSKIFPINSTILIPSYLLVREKLDKKQILSTLKDMDQDEYIQYSLKINQMLWERQADELFKHLSIIKSFPIQKEITQRMPASTTEEYAKLMYQIGQTDQFTHQTKELLDLVMTKDSGKSDTERFWFKGGSTAFLATCALWKESEKETVSLSLFIENYERTGIRWIHDNFKGFLDAFLIEVDFRQKVVESLNNSE
jgi:D-alanyl-D-alanine carboxypeptidase